MLIYTRFGFPLFLNENSFPGYFSIAYTSGEFMICKEIKLNRYGYRAKFLVLIAYFCKNLSSRW
jgi:hypothetical protein